jgi:hypothetical protein
MTESFRSDFIVDGNTLLQAISVVDYPVPLGKGLEGRMSGRTRRNIRETWIYTYV